MIFKSVVAVALPIAAYFFDGLYKLYLKNAFTAFEEEKKTQSNDSFVSHGMSFTDINEASVTFILC